MADWHFGHQNILAYCRRPWRTTDKMDHDLVKLHNSVVKPKDTVYVLGDVTLRGPDKKDWLRKILGRMNGTKILIFGNHDNWHWQHYLDVGFQSCHTFFELHHVGGMIHLCHDPARAQDKSKLWICGHLHNTAFNAPSHIAIVSVELTEYKPVPIENIVNGLRPGERTMTVRGRSTDILELSTPMDRARMIGPCSVIYPWKYNPKGGRP